MSERIEQRTGVAIRAAIAIAISVLGGGAVSAQTAPSGSGLGVTSPLGTAGMSPNSAVAPAGVGFGATQLDVGGLSPVPNSGASCTSGVASAGTSLFDGGGMGASAVGSASIGMAGAGATCRLTGTTASSSSGLTTPSGGAATGGFGTIPLGATEIDNGGLSPLVVPPAPGIATTSPSMTTPGTTTGP